MRLTILLAIIAWSTLAEGFNPFSRLYFGTGTKAPTTTTTTRATTTTTTTTRAPETTTTTTRRTTAPTTTTQPADPQPEFVNVEKGEPTPDDIAAVAALFDEIPEMKGKEGEVFNMDASFPGGIDPLTQRFDTLPHAARKIWDCLLRLAQEHVPGTPWDFDAPSTCLL